MEVAMIREQVGEGKRRGGAVTGAAEYLLILN